MTETAAYPLVHPETGEVLATDSAEHTDALALAAGRLKDAHQAMSRARRQADDARVVLEVLMAPGEVVPFADGYAVAMRPPASPRRRVDEAALRHHAEALAPLGLAPREEVVLRYPGVAALSAARAQLARAGLSPEQLVLTPPPGLPRVEVVEPEEARP